jgi:hypothetical protein
VYVLRLCWDFCHWDQRMCRGEVLGCASLHRGEIHAVCVQSQRRDREDPRRAFWCV